MKQDKILRSLERLVRYKNQIKKMVQDTFDEIHRLETELHLLLEDLEKGGKK